MKRRGPFRQQGPIQRQRPGQAPAGATEPQDSPPPVKAQLIRVLIVLLGLFIMYLGVHGLQKKFAPKTQPSYRSLLDQDKVELKAYKQKKAAWSNKVRMSLFRLAEQRDANARQVALQLTTSKKSGQRQAAAKALSYFSDQDANSALKQLLFDANANVRQAALASVPHNAPAVRKGWVKEYRLKFPHENELTALKAQYLLGSLQTQDQVLKTLGKDVLQKQDLDLRMKAWQVLMSIAPERQVTRSVARRLIRKAPDSELKGHVILYLSQLHDLWLKGKIVPLSQSHNRFVLSAVISALHLYCSQEMVSAVYKRLGQQQLGPELTNQFKDETITLHSLCPQIRVPHPSH